MFDKKQIQTTYGNTIINNQLSIINVLGVLQFYTPAALRLLLSAVRSYSYLLRASALRNTICASSRPTTSIPSSTRNTLWGLLKIAFVTKTCQFKQLFMQNKPNLRNAEINVTSVLTRHYGNKDRL